MRSLIIICFVVLIVAPAARADEPRCFGPEKAWCAWTLQQDRIDDGWRVVYTGRTGKTDAIVETIIDSPGNRPRLGIRVSPAREDDSAQVIISLRSDDGRPDQWRQFIGRNRQFDEGALRLALGRRALEAVLQAPESATLYVFVEFQTRGQARKDSHKMSLTGLPEALRYARLGR
ncbi:hypothetical protein [Emcibacter sp. SYSU 3D8]|uniref:hypothetical protein n=1 Tax=Emcibacter sp. SYSU 3D8 TaxID=3133969 RepID=UPI0031FE65BB